MYVVYYQQKLNKKLKDNKIYSLLILYAQLLNSIKYFFIIIINYCIASITGH
jgi:hypothetical protein